MSKTNEILNEKENSKIKAITKVSTAIDVLYEPLKKFILDRETKLEQINKIKKKKFDYNSCLKYIRDNLDHVFINHSDLDESRRKELDKIVKRCIEIRHKLAHQSSTRDVEPLCRLAAFLGRDVEESVRNVLKDEQSDTDEEKESWQSLKELGNRHVKENKFDEAIEAYTRAIRLDPNQPVLYSNRAIAELRLKMFKEAREDAEDAIDKASSFSPCEIQIKYYRLLSEALIGLNLLEEARLVCEKGLELDSRDSVLILRKRDIFSNLKSKFYDKYNPRDYKKIASRSKDLKSIATRKQKLHNLNPLDEDILDLNYEQYKEKAIQTKRLAEAHQWYHGLDGKKVDYKRAFEIFEAAANQGCAEGLFNVGECYEKGHGVHSQDYLKMLDFYQKAASQKPYIRINKKVLLPNLGVAEAIGSLGKTYQDGRGVDVDMNKAYKYFLRAAQLDQPESQNNIGKILLEGEVVAKNEKSAREWFKRAADKGIAEAEYNYARMLYNGEGGEIDEKGAFEYIRKASLQGLPQAFEQFQLLTRSINEKQTYKLFDDTLKELVSKKDTNALFLLGLNYLDGNSGYEKDLNLAYKYLKEAAELNHVEATFQLSKLLLDKLKRSEEGFQYCLKASEKGDLEASRQLMNLYAFGHGCERDETNARRIAIRVANRIKKLNEADELIIPEKNNTLSKDSIIKPGKLKESIPKNYIEKTIEFGKKLCEFEEKENLSKSGLNIDERMYRFLEYNTDTEQKDKFGNFLKMCKDFSNSPDVKPIKEPQQFIFEWMPKMIELAENGSITAARMVDGINKGFQAIECISKGENEKAMKLIKESVKECDQDYFSSMFIKEIREAVDKCDQNNPDVMYAKALLFKNDIQGCILFLNKCLRIHPNDATLYHHLGCMYGFTTDYVLSKKAFDRSLELDSSNPRCFYSKATSMRLQIDKTFLKKREIDEKLVNETIECYQTYLYRNPPDDRKVAKAYYSMSFLNTLLKNTENVKLYWFKALEAEKILLLILVSENVGLVYFPPKRLAELYLITQFGKCGQCMKPCPKYKCPCLMETYCDRNCQKNHWSIHKEVCKNRIIKS